MRLKNAITVMRRHDNQSYPWQNQPTVQSDARGKFVPFITDNDYSSELPSLEEFVYRNPVELGLEKFLLANPLKVEFGIATLCQRSRSLHGHW